MFVHHDGGGLAVTALRPDNVSMSPTQGLLNRDWGSQPHSGHFILESSWFVLVQLGVSSGPVHLLTGTLIKAEMTACFSKLFEQFSLSNGAYKLFLINTEQITNICSTNHCQSASVEQSSQ